MAPDKPINVTNAQDRAVTLVAIPAPRTDRAGLTTTLSEQNVIPCCHLSGDSGIQEDVKGPEAERLILQKMGIEEAASTSVSTRLWSCRFPQHHPGPVDGDRDCGSEKANAGMKGRQELRSPPFISPFYHAALTGSPKREYSI